MQQLEGSGTAVLYIGRTVFKGSTGQVCRHKSKISGKNIYIFNKK